MTLAMTATLSCDICPATLTADESPLHARNIALTARTIGWHHIERGFNRADRDLCPACWERVMNPQGVQGVLGATA